MSARARTADSLPLIQARFEGGPATADGARLVWSLDGAPPPQWFQWESRDDRGTVRRFTYLRTGWDLYSLVWSVVVEVRS